MHIFGTQGHIQPVPASQRPLAEGDFQAPPPFD